MKKLFCLLLALTMVMSLAAPVMADDPVTVTVWTFQAESEEPTAESNRFLKLAEDWNAEHDDIKIELVNAKTYDNVITAIPTSGTPDIFQMNWEYAPGLAARGAILDLTDYVENDAEFDKDDFLPAIWNLCSVDGHIYSIPFTASTTYILYNPKVMAAHNWDHFPETMEEMLQCALDCTELNEDGTIKTVGLHPTFPWHDTVLWPVAFGADWVDEEGNVNFNNDGIKEAYSFQMQLIEALGGYNQATAWGTDYYSTRCTTTDPVLTGEAAMRFNGDAGLAGFEESADQLDLVYGEDYAIAPLPTNMLTGGVFAINAKTENPDAAWQVMAYLNGKDAMAYRAEGGYGRGNFMPPRPVSTTRACPGGYGRDRVREDGRRHAPVRRAALLPHERLRQRVPDRHQHLHGRVLCRQPEP